jgi:hypothetical protein
MQGDPAKPSNQARAIVNMMKMDIGRKRLLGPTI